MWRALIRSVAGTRRLLCALPLLLAATARADDAAAARVRELRREAGLAFRRGDTERARAGATEALALAESALPPGDPETVRCLDSLAVLRGAAYEWDAAVDLLRRASALASRADGPDRSLEIESLECLVGALDHREEAARYEASRREREGLAPAPQPVADAGVAETEERLARLRGGAPPAREGVEAWIAPVHGRAPRALLGPLAGADLLSHQAGEELRRGDSEFAELHAAAAVRLARAAVPDDPAVLAEFVIRLGEARAANADAPLAAAAYQLALDLLGAAGDDVSPQVVEALLGAADALRAAGDDDAADAALARAEHVVAGAAYDGTELRYRVRTARARRELDHGRAEAAVALLRANPLPVDPLVGRDDPWHPLEIADACLCAQRWEDAAVALAESTEVFELEYALDGHHGPGWSEPPPPPARLAVVRAAEASIRGDRGETLTVLTQQLARYRRSVSGRDDEERPVRAFGGRPGASYATDEQELRDVLQCLWSAAFRAGSTPGERAAGLQAAIDFKAEELEDVRSLLERLHRLVEPEVAARMLRDWQGACAARASAALGGAADPEQLALSRVRFESARRALLAAVADHRRTARAAAPDSITAALPAGTALLEFVRFRPFDPRASRPAARFGPARYGVYVLRAGVAPATIDLGAAADIDADVGRALALLGAPDDPAAARAVCRRLHTRLLEPLAPAVEGATRLVVSPDGPLQSLPFGVLVDATGRYLLESCEVSVVTSARDLLAVSSPGRANRHVVVLAAPDYDLADAGVAASATATAPRRAFSALPGTHSEAVAVRALFDDAIVLEGRDAAEARLKRDVSRPLVLHLATHGFFARLGAAGRAEGSREGSLQLEQGAPMAAVVGRDPLVAGGLALAAANRAGTGGEDGLLTALELCSLDLTDTRLVVLSACETGVGDATTGQGLRGLRWAATAAGAESSITSLWRVDDPATARLMGDLYANLRRGMTRSAALREAQLALLRAGPAHAHPYYWGAFVLAGDAAPIPEFAATGQVVVRSAPSERTTTPAPPPPVVRLERVAWELRLDDGEEITTRPVVAGDALLVTTNSASTGSSLRAVGAADGAPRWSLALDRWVQARPAVDATSAYVADRDGGVVAVALDSGAALWQARVPRAATAGPVACGDDLVLLTVGDAQHGGSGAVGLDRRTGRERWRRGIAPGRLDYASPVADGETVFVAYWALGRFGQTQVVALAAGGGDVRWNTASVGLSADDVLIAGDTVIVDGYQRLGGVGAALALDAASGRQLWHVSLVQGEGTLAAPLGEPVRTALVRAGFLAQSVHLLDVLSGAVVRHAPAGALCLDVARVEGGAVCCRIVSRSPDVSELVLLGLDSDMATRTLRVERDLIHVVAAPGVPLIASGTRSLVAVE